MRRHKLMPRRIGAAIDLVSSMSGVVVILRIERGTHSSAAPALGRLRMMVRLSITSTSSNRGSRRITSLVTFTLRNGNEYAVKDIEIACAFAGRDGSHLTDRRRVIADTVSMKSRKTYSGMLIGFVNVNANKAKCSLVTANRT